MEIHEAIKEAIRLILTLNPDLISATKISLFVSLFSTGIATILGVPTGFLIGVANFPGRNILRVIFNTLMGFPTVVVGLLCYALFTRKGILGDFGLLFTPTAMIIGQVVLAFPLITALSLSATQSIDKRVWSTAMTLGATRLQAAWLVIKEGRFSYFSAIAAGFGRVFAEIGISLMLGGNIRFYTRNITTTIALETSKGQFAMGLALGFLLLTISLFINILFHRFQGKVTNPWITS